MMPIYMIFISSFIIQYLMSYIMTYRAADITITLDKIYMATIMGLAMVVVDITAHSFNLTKITPFLIGLLFVIFLYKYQIGIDDENYVKEMIEHHSMALLTSNEIIKKSANPYVTDIAQRIISTQEKEISEMRNILKMLD